MMRCPFGYDRKAVTTNEGAPVENPDNFQRAGLDGPALLQDAHLLEKLQHFDRERIPERVVHARGFGAKGFFECTDGSFNEVTMAAPFAELGKRTDVFVRFSTVAGSRGSADTGRDVRGFAVKFYTDQGNWDLVGNNLGPFFIQSGVKFPDFVHAVKPEPQHEIPQANSNHSSFWTFCVEQPETTHMLMWVMSDRALPRSFACMAGFGVHTFVLVNKEGKWVYCKFHWLPHAGCHSLLEKEAEHIRGADPDFHRQDMVARIQKIEAAGGEDKQRLASWDLCVQTLTEEEAHQLPFNILDATKIIPEKYARLRKVGTMTLNRLCADYFAETEQVAFCPGNLCPGILPSNDPLLQVRLFSYKDTALHRLGPNYQQLPVNRPHCTVNNFNRDGAMQTQVITGPNYPHPTEGAMLDLPGPAIRSSAAPTFKRPPQFDSDYFSQAGLFYRSQVPSEQTHMVEAFAGQFNAFLSSEGAEPLVKTMLQRLYHVDTDLADRVRHLVMPECEVTPVPLTDTSIDPILSTIYGRDSLTNAQVAILIIPDTPMEVVDECRKILEEAKLTVTTIGMSRAVGKVDKIENTTIPSLYDGLVAFVPGSQMSVKCPQFTHWTETFCQEHKPIVFVYLDASHVVTVANEDKGVWTFKDFRSEQIRSITSNLKQRYFEEDQNL